MLFYQQVLNKNSHNIFIREKQKNKNMKESYCCESLLSVNNGDKLLFRFVTYEKKFYTHLHKKRDKLS